MRNPGICFGWRLGFSQRNFPLEDRVVIVVVVVIGDGVYCLRRRLAVTWVLLICI